MADAERATLKKLAALVEKQRELQANIYEITEEMQRLLSGEPGIAVILKDLESTYDAVWGCRYAGGQIKQYVWSYAKDRPALKRLVRNLGVDELMLRFSRYLANDDPFFIRARHPFGLFVSSVNSHAGPATAAPLELSEAPADCRHVPRCPSDVQHTARRQQDIRR